MACTEEEMGTGSIEAVPTQTRHWLMEVPSLKTIVSGYFSHRYVPIWNENVPAEVKDLVYEHRLGPPLQKPSCSCHRHGGTAHMEFCRKPDCPYMKKYVWHAQRCVWVPGETIYFTGKTT